MTLTERVPASADPDAVFDAFAAWAKGLGLEPVPAPGGGAHRGRLRVERHPEHADRLGQEPRRDRAPTSPPWPAASARYYTAPIKALVSEKFFALCDAFGSG